MKIKLNWHHIPFLIIVLVNAACTTIEPPNRGKLSDATRLASDSYAGERILAQAENRPKMLVEEEVQASEVEDEAHTSPDDAQWQKSLTFSKGYGRGSGVYENASHWMIQVAGENKGLLLSKIYFGYEGVSLSSESSIHQSIDDNLNIFFLGIGVQRFFAPYPAVIRPYLSFGAGGAFMFWSYRNAFTTEGGETVHGDNLGGFLITTAAGLEYKPVQYISVALQVNPKLYLWNERTGWGFDNDEFDPLGVISLGVSATLHF